MNLRTRGGEGVKKSEIVADVINGSPLLLLLLLILNSLLVFEHMRVHGIFMMVELLKTFLSCKITQADKIRDMYCTRFKSDFAPL